MVTSEDIIAEVTHVLRYPRICGRYNLTEDDIAAVVDSLSTDRCWHASIIDLLRNSLSTRV